MRLLLAIGVLSLVGCSRQAVVVDNYEDVCEIVQITRNDQMHTFYVETYECDENTGDGIVDLSTDNRPERQRKEHVHTNTRL